MENDRTDVAHLFMFIKSIKNQGNNILILICGWYLVEIWSRLEVGQNSKIMKVIKMDLPIVGKFGGLWHKFKTRFVPPHTVLGRSAGVFV